MKGKNEKGERCGGTIEEIVSRKDAKKRKSHKENPFASKVAIRN